VSPGLIAVVILLAGVALVVIATLVDRRSARRAAGEESPRTNTDAAPHATSSPRTAPAQAPYVTARQLLDDAPRAEAFSPAQERELASELSSARTVSCRLAAPTLATHTGTRAVLDRPRLLACEDAVLSVRELLVLMGRAADEATPLLIAAPEMDADTLQTVIANKLAGTLPVAVVFGERDAITTLATATGTAPVPASDRMAGAASWDGLGRCDRIVVDEKQTWIVGGVPDPEPPRPVPEWDSVARAEFDDD